MPTGEPLANDHVNVVALEQDVFKYRELPFLFHIPCPTTTQNAVFTSLYPQYTNQVRQMSNADLVAIVVVVIH